MPAATTKQMPTTPAGPGTWCSTTRPTIIANAGSRLINVPNAAVVSRRSANSSKAKGTTGSRIAKPMPISRISGVIRGSTAGPTAMVATNPATGIDTASALMPETSSPARWVSRM